MGWDIQQEPTKNRY